MGAWQLFTISTLIQNLIIITLGEQKYLLAVIILILRRVPFLLWPSLSQPKKRAAKWLDPGIFVSETLPQFKHFKYRIEEKVQPCLSRRILYIKRSGLHFKENEWKTTGLKLLVWQAGLSKTFAKIQYLMSAAFGEAIQCSIWPDQTDKLANIGANPTPSKKKMVRAV